MQSDRTDLSPTPEPWCRQEIAEQAHPADGAGTAAEQGISVEIPAPPDGGTFAPAPPAEVTEPAAATSSEEPPVLTATLPPLDLDSLPLGTIDLEAVDWKPVSPRYVSLLLITKSVWGLILVAIAALPALFTAGLGWWNWAPWAYIGLPALMLALRLLSLALTTRQVRAIGYSERADHLLIKRGIMFRKVTTIPYGRIQYVDVESGPLESQRKLASITIKTAAGSTALPGLDAQDAAQLREVLTDLSDARMVGL